MPNLATRTAAVDPRRAHLHVAELQAQLVRSRQHVASLQARVAELEAADARLRWAASHDELTGLPNRRLFYALAPHLLADGHGRLAVVVLLDLDDFKPVNDTWGHLVGDQVLCTVARRLATAAPDHLVARIGGDEFAAVLKDPHGSGRPSWWQPKVAALYRALARPIPVAGHQEVAVTASVGVAPASPQAPIRDLLYRADQAMYQAKTGRGSTAIQVWRPGLNQHSTVMGTHRRTPRRHRPRRRPLQYFSRTSEWQ